MCLASILDLWDPFVFTEIWIWINRLTEIVFFCFKKKMFLSNFFFKEFNYTIKNL